MKRALVLSAIAGLVVGAACARRMPPPVTAMDADRTHISLADLQAGRTLTIRKCGGCHAPPLPSDHSASEWPRSLDEMSSRANLDPSQRRTIEQYLVAMSAR